MNAMRVIFSLLLVGIFASCGNKKAPDVSHVKVELKVERFEHDFFAIDTNNINASLDQLHQKYPGFLQDYVYNILGISPQADSSVVMQEQLKSFYRSYLPVKDSADKVFTNMNDIVADTRKGLQYAKYYFPNYRLPNRFITFIGPINSYANILTNDGLAVGLQLYMGGNYSLYQTQAGQEMYPGYISRKFEPRYIPVNTIRTIVDDMYPDRSAGRPLVEQMIEAGKRLYLLDHLLPQIADTLKTGYTAAQLKGAYANEELIWTYFVNNDLLFAIDPSITKDYMNEAPNTAVLGAASPGFIGQFVGWQIVKKWMEKHEDLKLQKLMETDPKIIFQQAKYKP